MRSLLPILAPPSDPTPTPAASMPAVAGSTVAARAQDRTAAALARPNPKRGAMANVLEKLEVDDLQYRCRPPLDLEHLVGRHVDTRHREIDLSGDEIGQQTLGQNDPVSLVLRQLEELHVPARRPNALECPAVVRAHRQALPYLEFRAFPEEVQQRPSAFEVVPLGNTLNELEGPAKVSMFIHQLEPVIVRQATIVEANSLAPRFVGMPMPTFDSRLCPSTGGVAPEANRPKRRQLDRWDAGRVDPESQVAILFRIAPQPIGLVVLDTKFPTPADADWPEGLGVGVEFLDELESKSAIPDCLLTCTEFRLIFTQPFRHGLHR